MTGVRISNRLRLQRGGRHINSSLLSFGPPPGTEKPLQIGETAGVASLFDVMKQMPSAAVPILPTFGKKDFEVPWRCGIQCCSPPVWRNLEFEPIRYAATFIAGLPRDFAVGQTLFAQSAELFEYLPARLPMCETGAPAMCGGVNNCVLRQEALPVARPERLICSSIAERRFWIR